MRKFILLSIMLVTFYSTGFCQTDPFRCVDEYLMPYGNRFLVWERPQLPVRTFYVDQHHPEASDENPGTKSAPFLTINRAARVLQAGERVVISRGIYRETIVPVHGGNGPDSMIIYEAAPGEKVIVKGTELLDPSGWMPSRGWQVGGRDHYGVIPDSILDRVLQYNLNAIDFKGYNPFGMLNLMEDPSHLDHTKVKMETHFQKRGMVFVNGIPLEQVNRPVELSGKPAGAFWPEHNGMRIHVRFPDGIDFREAETEITTKEQLFAPSEYGLGYIRLSGIHFSKAGNGFPVPQRGIVSTSRGHHWIIEDCLIEWANSLGVDLGNEMWNTTVGPQIGHHIFRRNIIRNCGVSGLQGQRGEYYLIEDNLFENIGWHDVEHGCESGAIKLHLSRNTLIRRNVFRNIVHAPGIWLDYLASENCRITKNVFTGITTARGAIYIEVSREHMRIDHNIFHGLRSQYWISGDYGAGGSALYTDGSDSIRFEYNLAFDIENTGFGAYANAGRILRGRGGTDRHHEVVRNIFVDCRKHAIEFPNVHHSSNYNIFSNMPAGYLKIRYPEPPMLLDLKAWQDYYHWEKNGRLLPGLRFELDSENLVLTFKGNESIPEGTGPFKGSLLPGMVLSVDPRKL